jgi:hypothetical protein
MGLGLESLESGELQFSVKVEIGAGVLGRPSDDLLVKPLLSPLDQPALQGLSCHGRRWLPRARSLVAEHLVELSR